MPTSTSPRTASDAGLSLLELIVVVAIVSVLFGIGIGVFHRVVQPERLASGQVLDAVRSARTFAREHGTGAAIVVEPERGRVFVTGLRTVGNWHFEDVAGTGWPVSASYDATALRSRGAIGSGLVLEKGGRLTIPSPPGSFDSPDGFGVAVSLQPAAAPRPMTILERPGSWALQLDDDGNVRVVLELAAAEEPETYPYTVAGSALPTDRFSRLTVTFDGRALRVTRDGRPLESTTLFEVARPLVVVPGIEVGTGNESDRYVGRMDELHLSSVVVDRFREMAEGVRLEGAARRVQVDGFGHLDPSWHSTPEQIHVVHGEPPVRTVVELGLLGTVRSWEESPDAVSVAPEGEAP